MNRRPPTTTGCARAAMTPGKPNAHFSFSRGTSGARDAALVGGDVSRVRDRAAPAVPVRASWSGSDIAGAAVVQRADVGNRRRRSDRAAGERARRRPFSPPRSGRSPAGHPAGRERRDNRSPARTAAAPRGSARASRRSAADGTSRTTSDKSPRRRAPARTQPPHSQREQSVTHSFAVSSLNPYFDPTSNFPLSTLSFLYPIGFDGSRPFADSQGYRFVSSPA